MALAALIRQGVEAAPVSQKAGSLRDALDAACVGLEVAPEEVRASLAPEDVEAWEAGQLSVDTLTAYARSLIQLRAMAGGQVPSHYTAAAVCRQCGPVWTWPEDGKATVRPHALDGCPWCSNRLQGLPIPRPAAIHCGSCRHYVRHVDHPHLGECAVGEPWPAAAGFWDSAPRDCRRWLPTEDPS